MFAPDGLLWTGVVGAGLIGSTLAIAVLRGRRSIPSMAQVIADVEAEPARAVAVPARVAGRRSGAELRSKGAREP